METSIYSLLHEKKMIRSLEDSEIPFISLKNENNEVVLRGNALGLIELADYIVFIALEKFNGAHIHLDRDNFFDIADKELIISKYSKVLEVDDEKAMKGKAKDSKGGGGQ